MNTKNTLIAIVALFATTATYAQVGIGTTTPHATAALDVESTTKGFLPPRMTDVQRNAIASPAEGLTIYNKEVNCLQWFNGSGWFDACDGSTFFVPILGSGFTNGFQNNNTCTTKVISVTPCSAVSGTTESTVLADGTLYNWADAGSYMSGGTADALVEIGGQCWFGRNTNAPSPYTGTNDFDGFHGGGSEPAVGEGRLYQWDAAMNGSDTERDQGVCPTGWHVPSDCEWMYLENSLGMSTTDQENTGSYRGTEGQKLSTLVSAPATNSSGFTALLAGSRGAFGAFNDRGDRGVWWSSSEDGTTNAQRRFLFSSEAGVFRNINTKDDGFSVRCLKD